MNSYKASTSTSAPNMFNKNGKIDQAIIDQIVSSAITSEQGRSKLAQAMIAPIRARLNYSNIARTMSCLGPFKKYYVCA